MFQLPSSQAIHPSSSWAAGRAVVRRLCEHMISGDGAIRRSVKRACNRAPRLPSGPPLPIDTGADLGLLFPLVISPSDKTGPTRQPNNGWKVFAHLSRGSARQILPTPLSAIYLIAPDPIWWLGLTRRSPPSLVSTPAPEASGLSSTVTRGVVSGHHTYLDHIPTGRNYRHVKAFTFTTYIIAKKLPRESIVSSFNRIKLQSLVLTVISIVKLKIKLFI
ncbi:hypothetical protein J6590_029395 [Homalodisca vitripennis]|nr:hypothetical protein J6590_029395 [Homalodisca vitripennis]